MTAIHRSVTLSDIAALTGVTPAAVSNWRRRYENFPQSTTVDGQEQFAIGGIAKWLEGRKIPADARTADEPSGTTYGDRFGRNAGLALPDAGPTDSGRRTDVETAAELDLWSAYDRLRGLMAMSAIGDLLLSLLYICGRHPTAWEELLHDPNVTPSKVADVLGNVLPNTVWNRVSREPAFAEFPKDRSKELAQVVSLVDSIGSWQDPRVPFYAWAFDKLLNRMAIAEGRKGGEFHTPESIVQLAVRLTKPSASDQISDPWCRAGQFLRASVDATRAAGAVGNAMVVDGSDPNSQTCRWAYMSLHLRGVEPDIRQGYIDSLHAQTSSPRYDLVMTNPPFNVSHWSSGPARFGSWPYGPPPEHNANFAWLQIAVSSLRHGGRAAVVMSNGAGTSQNTQERDIRAAMVEGGVVKALIALPAHLFSSTSIPVTMWLLEPAATGQRSDVLFVDATEMGNMQERNLRILSSADLDGIVQAYEIWRGGSRISLPPFAQRVELERLRASDYRLNPREYVAPSTQVVDTIILADDIRRLSREVDRLRDLCNVADEELFRRLGDLEI